MIPADRIKEQIASLGISQVKAAAVIGIAERTMRKYCAEGAPLYISDALERYNADRDALDVRLQAIGVTISEEKNDEPVLPRA
jgi:endonuclease III